MNFFKVETLQLAFKTMHPDRDIAGQSKIFMKEINFYSEIIPAIEQFQEIVKIPKSERIDAFIRYFGSRLSLNPDVKSADADVILLLENMKSLNYVSPNLWDRFDKDQAMACLKVCKRTFQLFRSIKIENSFPFALATGKIACSVDRNATAAAVTLLLQS